MLFYFVVLGPYDDLFFASTNITRGTCLYPMNIAAPTIRSLTIDININSMMVLLFGILNVALFEFC